MYPDSITVSMSSIVLVAAFSLAWFVVGIFVGRLVVDRPSTGGRNRRRGGNQRQSQQPKQRSGSVEIYVGNLSYDVTEKDLRKAFGAYGQVASIRIIKNRANGKSKGYGFVEMPDRREALAGIKAMSGNDLKGRRMVANEAKSRPRD